MLFTTEDQLPVCQPCRSRLLPIAVVKRCRVCSMPLISEKTVCTRCRLRTYAFGSQFAVFAYTGVIKELLYQYKFKHQKKLAPLLAGYLACAAGSRFPAVPLVPVPASPAGKKKRGWDHIGVIAGILKKQYRIPVLACLSRDKSRQQKSLDFETRIANLQGKIHCLQPAGLAGKHLLLLDDIFTTGATVSECARVLLAAGAAGVDALTIALD